MSNVFLLYPLNSQTIGINGVTDVSTGLFLNSATVTATLFDENGNADPTINALPLAYVPNTQGNYQGIVPATFNAPTGTGYTLQFRVVNQTSQALYDIVARVVKRQFTSG